MPWHQEAMKGVASCDKPRGAASRPWSGDARMGKPRRWMPPILRGIHTRSEAHAGKWNISVPAGKESNRDSPSSGERKGNSLNPTYAKSVCVVCGGSKAFAG